MDPQQNQIQAALFFPSLENEEKLAQELAQCTKELQIAIYTFTNKLLANTILNLVKEKNISVRIVSDDVEANKVYSLVGVLREANSSNIEVRIDNNARALMHNKYVIIDKKKVITGSFNWTQQAVRMNNENVVILEGKQIANEYYQNFEKLWEQFADNKYKVEKEIKQKGKDMYKKLDPELLKKLKKEQIKKATYSKLKEKILKKSKIQKSSKKIKKQKLPENQEKSYKNNNNKEIEIETDSDEDYEPEEQIKKSKRRIQYVKKQEKQGNQNQFQDKLFQIFKKATIVGGFVAASVLHYNVLQDIQQN